MKKLTVTHRTTYRYAQPVKIGEHRAMFRPRDSHDMRVIDARLAITPAGAPIRWMHDVFGNSVAYIGFDIEASELSIESIIELEHYGLPQPDYQIADFARVLPFAYGADETQDLGRTTDRHYPDEEHLIDAWARRFLKPEGTSDTLEVLLAMNGAIKEEFAYQARDAHGTQTPLETLALKSGSCRDFALFLMEAARSLGLAARFVTGYLYDPAADPASGSDNGGGLAVNGAGATHAWTQIYLPGAGWVELDPTNGIVGGPHLIRIAVTRTPEQAVPLAGKWFGAANDFLGMEVSVNVHADA